MKRSRSRRKRWLLAIGVAFLIWLVASWAVAYRLTRRPHALFAEPVPHLSWGRIEAHRLTTRDGQELGAWYVPGAVFVNTCGIGAFC